MTTGQSRVRIGQQGGVVQLVGPAAPTGPGHWTTDKPVFVTVELKADTDLYNWWAGFYNLLPSFDGNASPVLYPTQTTNAAGVSGNGMSWWGFNLAYGVGKQFPYSSDSDMSSVGVENEVFSLRRHWQSGVRETPTYSPTRFWVAVDYTFWDFYRLVGYPAAYADFEVSSRVTSTAIALFNPEERLHCGLFWVTTDGELHGRVVAGDPMPEGWADPWTFGQVAWTPDTDMVSPVLHFGPTVSLGSVVSFGAESECVTAVAENVGDGRILVCYLSGGGLVVGRIVTRNGMSLVASAPVPLTETISVNMSLQMTIEHPSVADGLAENYEVLLTMGAVTSASVLRFAVRGGQIDVSGAAEGFWGQNEFDPNVQSFSVWASSAFTGAGRVAIVRTLVAMDNAAPGDLGPRLKILDRSTMVSILASPGSDGWWQVVDLNLPSLQGGTAVMGYPDGRIIVITSRSNVQ